MSKTFRPWHIDDVWLLPASIHDFVPAGHVAHFIRDTVREGLDLGALLASYDDERGYPPYQPAMMTALLLYAYSQGIYSSRRIARACEERVDFMAVTGLNKPDFRTISEFRRRHLEALTISTSSQRLPRLRCAANEARCRKSSGVAMGCVRRISTRRWPRPYLTN